MFIKKFDMTKPQSPRLQPDPPKLTAAGFLAVFIIAIFLILCVA